MSWSWIFFGDFKIPKPCLPELARQIPPFLTELKTIRDTAALCDAIYEGDQLHLRRVFEKSLHDDTVGELEAQFNALLARGASGKGCIMGFSLDGGPEDVGTLFTLGKGSVERREMTAAELRAAAKAKAHRAIVERFDEAYEGG